MGTVILLVLVAVVAGLMARAALHKNDSPREATLTAISAEGDHPRYEGYDADALEESRQDTLRRLHDRW